jgi:hypothetical protein
MKNSFFKIYVYPFLVLVTSLLPWYFFARFVLNIDIDQILLQSFNGSEWRLTRFKIFFILAYITIYIGWVFFNRWKEKDPEQRLQAFFLAYGKFIALIISFHFFAFILLVLI